MGLGLFRKKETEQITKNLAKELISHIKDKESKDIKPQTSQNEKKHMLEVLKSGTSHASTYETPVRLNKISQQQSC